MGDFIRLDGKDFLDGSWLLDQRPGPTWFVGFGGIVRLAERNGMGWAATDVVVRHWNGNAFDTPEIRAGMYRFTEKAEQVSGHVSPLSRFIERNLAPLFREILAQGRWSVSERAALAVSLGWRTRNLQTLWGRRLVFGTWAQENAGAGTLRLDTGLSNFEEKMRFGLKQIGLLSAVQETPGGGSLTPLKVRSTFRNRNALRGAWKSNAVGRFDGTYSFNGAIRFNSGTTMEEVT